ncbi:MAG: hypothetical protein ACYS8Z_25470, partial [Planctomycetota bacterium]
MPDSEKVVLLIFLMLLGAIYFLEAALLIHFAFSRKRGRGRGNTLLKKPAIVLHLAAIVGVVCMLYGFFIEPNRVEVATIEIRTEKLKEASFRIVQISDLHCDKEPRNEQRVVELINALDADVVV